MTNPWTTFLMVGMGGFTGSVARYGLTLALQRFPVAWPIGTLTANISGCLAIGVLAGLFEHGEALSPAIRIALVTGFCGGFTTMSSMIYETAEMLRASEYFHAIIYSAGTFLLSMTSFIAGVMIIRFLVKIGGGLWS